MGACKMIRFIALLLLLVVGSVRASTWTKETGWLLQPDPNGGYSVLPGGSSSGSHSTSCTSSTCTRSGSLPTPHGNPRGTLTPSTGFSKGALAAGVLGLGGRVLPWLSLGYGIYDWYKSAGLDHDPEQGTMVTGGGLAYYGVVDNIVGGKPMRFARSDTGLSSLGAMCGAVSPNWMAAGAPAYYVSNGKHISTCGYWSNGNWYMTSSTVSVTVDKLCVAPDLSGTTQPVNGQCSGVTRQAVDAAVAAQRLADAPVTEAVLRKVLDEVLQGGGSLQDTGVHSLSGPASVPGGTSTKQVTKADGTTAVSVTNTTYNYTYNNNSMTVSKTEKTTNPDGSTEQTTSTPEKTECEKNPNSVGCADLTNNETGKPTWETKNVVYQVDSLGLPAACPAPWTGVVHGWALSMSWQPACDQAPAIRAGVLALASLTALFFIITTVRS